MSIENDKKHPWLEIYPISKISKYLILGTHPPMPYCGKLEFYYGNMSEFWRFLDEVYPKNNSDKILVSAYREVAVEYARNQPKTVTYNNIYWK